MDFEKDTIRDLRLQKGMSQQAFARAIGTSRQMLDRWEKGDCMPGVGSLTKICRAFGITIDFFFTENDVCTQHKEKCEVQQ
jgi:transcriptional regulator with XRE-family HTH domain